LNCCDVIVNVVNIVILLRYYDMSLRYCEYEFEIL
jgi:hypothetical protein